MVVEFSPVSQVHQLTGLLSPRFWRFRGAARPRTTELLLWLVLGGWMVVRVWRMGVLMVAVALTPPLLVLLRLCPAVVVGRYDPREDGVDRF